MTTDVLSPKPKAALAETTKPKLTATLSAADAERYKVASEYLFTPSHKKYLVALTELLNRREEEANKSPEKRRLGYDLNFVNKRIESYFALAERAKTIIALERKMSPTETAKEPVLVATVEKRAA